MARKGLWVHPQRLSLLSPLFLYLSHMQGHLSPTDPDDGSDFKLDAFSSPCETFDPHYGVGGYSGDGDITRPDNQSEFKNYVMENSERKGVHFVMADGVSVSTLLSVILWSGGDIAVFTSRLYSLSSLSPLFTLPRLTMSFPHLPPSLGPSQGISVEGQENKQELLLKQLVLCQYATSLSILRLGQRTQCVYCLFMFDVWLWVVLAFPFC